ncbi:MAG: pyridoxal phosphate-dependent aminotransferase [Solirubrobacteraceae bacterium]
MQTSIPIDLATRIPVMTQASVRDAAKAALDAGATHYTDRPGIRELREAVALKLAESNRIAVAPADEVLITCGVQEALFLALQILAGGGDEVIITGPALPEDVELVRSVGAAARIAPADDQLRLDVNRVEELITENTRVILLRSPTAVGEVVAYPILAQLGALVTKHDLRVVTVESDEALTAAGIEHRSIGEVDGLAPRTVTINDFSGAGLEAWRVGYLAAQRPLMAGMRRLKQELSICSPAVSQYAALDAIRRSDGHAAALRDQLDVRRAAFAQALAQTDLEYVSPQAGMYVFAKPAPGVPVTSAILRAAEARIMVADGALAGADGWLRLTLNQDPEVLSAAAFELANLVGQIPAKAAP